MRNCILIFIRAFDLTKNLTTFFSKFAKGCNSNIKAVDNCGCLSLISHHPPHRSKLNNEISSIMWKMLGSRTILFGMICLILNFKVGVNNCQTSYPYQICNNEKLNVSQVLIDVKKFKCAQWKWTAKWNVVSIYAFLRERDS